jgi:predicted nucleic acid-binding Zn ribbon protein
MARVSAVRLEDGVLLVEAQTIAWAAAIMRTTPMILGRLQSMLGADTVREIRLRK